MGFDVTLFSGVTARTSSCRMTTLDLCGVRISKSPLSAVFNCWICCHVISIKIVIADLTDDCNRYDGRYVLTVV